MEMKCHGRSSEAKRCSPQPRWTAPREDTGPEGSKWYEIFGSEEYIYWAFQYAHDVLEALEPGSAAGKLYYNDDNMTLKTGRVIPMLDAVRDQGVPVDGIGMHAAEVMLTPELEASQAAAYGDLFALFRAHAADITSVTLWGLSDDATWLDSEPVSGRNNCPLLWSDAHEPKAAYFSVRDFE